MKDIFAPYKIAKQLKELEFKEPCIAYYKPNTTYTTMFNHYYGTNYYKNDIITAPTWEQVFKWFREKGLIGEVVGLFSGENFYFEIRRKQDNLNIRINIGNYYSNYEETRENLALELIELYKKQNNG